MQIQEERIDRKLSAQGTRDKGKLIFAAFIVIFMNHEACGKLQNSIAIQKQTRKGLIYKNKPCKFH